LRISYLLLFLLLVQVAAAVDICQSEQDPADIPCMIYSSYKPASCTATLFIYNETGANIQNSTWSDGEPFCKVEWNITTLGSYVYNSTIESGQIVVGGDNMWLVGILLLPLGIGALFLLWAHGLSEEQEVLKWFFRLLALLMLFPTYVVANIIIGQNPNYSGLEQAFNMTLLTWLFWFMMALMLIWVIYKTFAAFKMSKNDELEKGILR